jgi:hypothetical protein
MAMVAYKGELKDVFGWFTDAAGVLIAPTAAVLHQKTPAGVLTTPTVTAGTAPDAFTIAAGLGITGPYYRVRVDLNEVGTWKFKWKPTGTGQSATPDLDVVVEATVFP